LGIQDNISAASRQLDRLKASERDRSEVEKAKKELAEGAAAS